MSGLYFILLQGEFASYHSLFSVSITSFHRSETVQWIIRFQRCESPNAHLRRNPLLTHECLQLSADALIAQKRAEIAAKIAAMKKGGSLTPAPPTPSPAATPPVVPSPHGPSPSPGPSATDDLSRRVAEAKRRVAEAQSKLAVKDNPYMVCHCFFRT